MCILATFKLIKWEQRKLPNVVLGLFLCPKYTHNIGASPRDNAIMAYRLSLDSLNNGKWAPSFFACKFKIK